MEKFKDTFSVKRIISDLMKANGIGIFRTFRVGDLLWGYEDPLLKVIKPMVEMDDHFGLFYKVSVRGVCCQSSLLLVQVLFL